MNYIYHPGLNTVKQSYVGHQANRQTYPSEQLESWWITSVKMYNHTKRKTNSTQQQQQQQQQQTTTTTNNNNNKQQNNSDNEKQQWH